MTKSIFSQRVKVEQDEEYAKQASIIVLLKGEYDGDIIVQIRTIKLSREGRVWQVNAVEVSGF